MSSRITYLATACVTLITACLGAFPVFVAPAYAAPPTSNPANTGQALEIAPPVINLTANPGQTIKTQILLRDISSGSLIVTGQANDFVAAGEDGTPKVILNEEANNPYS